MFQQSLPMPRAGKHANNAIRCEDQRIPQQRPTRLARAKNNPLDPDYLAGKYINLTFILSQVQ